MDSCKELFAHLDRSRQRFLDFWVDITNLESPTGDKEGLDRVGRRIAQEGEKSGFRVEFIPQENAGDLVQVTLDNGSTEKPMLLSAHIDTVHAVGSFGTPAVRIQGEKIYGPGILDDKGGVAASLYAMDALKKAGYTKRNVVFIAQTDEEVSSLYSGGATIDYICRQALGCEAFLNCESLHAGEAILRRKGIARYELSIQGVAAHSARCDRGTSALLEAAHKIIQIEKYKDRNAITCNCSLISAGEVANSVPDHCRFTVDVRFFTQAQYEEIDGALQEIAAASYIGNTTCTLRCVSRRPAMELTEKNLAFLEKINVIYRDNAMKTLKVGTSLGGSDASNVSALGVRTVDSIGCEGGKIHTLEEFAYLRSLEESAKRIAAIVYCYDQ